MLHEIPLADPEGLVGLAPKIWLHNYQGRDPLIMDSLDRAKHLMLKLWPGRRRYLQAYQLVARELMHQRRTFRQNIVKVIPLFHIRRYRIGQGFTSSRGNPNRPKA